MVRSWDGILGIILLLLKIASLIRCSKSCQDEATPYAYVHHGEIGGHIHLSVNAYMVGHTWVKNGKPLTGSKCNNYSQPDCLNAKLFAVENFANLRLLNIALENSGKYIVKLFCPLYRAIYSFEVIVKSNPILYINCKDMVVYEGESISCICEAINTDSPASVTWIWKKTQHANLEVKNFTGILTLVNVSRSESGKYSCHAKDNNSVKNISFKLDVVPKSTTPTNKQPMVKIDCLNITIPDELCLKKEKNDIDGNKIEWKIRIVVAGCSFLAGVVMSCVLISSRKKLCDKKNRYRSSVYDDVSPRPAKEGLRDSWPEENESSHEYDVPESGNI